MTIQELYAEIGGNYEHALKIMKMDKMINRYILKLKSSHVYEELMKAGETLDPKAMFESAHAMKGVCANLGLDTLSDAASDFAEEFRPGNERKHSDDEVREMLASITGMYRRVDEGITKYENS